jgi:phage gp36-like protein
MIAEADHNNDHVINCEEFIRLMLSTSGDRRVTAPSIHHLARSASAIRYYNGIDTILPLYYTVPLLIAVCTYIAVYLYVCNVVSSASCTKRTQTHCTAKKLLHRVMHGAYLVIIALRNSRRVK